MKITKSKLKQIIREELQKAFKENRVATVEPTDIEGYEARLPPGASASGRTHAGPAASYESNAQYFVVTLDDGNQLHAQIFGDNTIELFDMMDSPVDDENNLLSKN